MFQRQFHIRYNNEACPTFSYFTSIWATSKPHVKVRETFRITKSAICKYVKVELWVEITEGKSTKSILDQNNAHITFVGRELREYKWKKGLGKLHPDDYLSCVTDGAYQKKLVIPYFVTKTKGHRGHVLYFHLIAVLQHDPINHLCL